MSGSQPTGNADGITEELVSVVLARVTETTNPVIAACLTVLANRGMYTHRELPQVARNISARLGEEGMTKLTNQLVDQFVHALAGGSR